MGIFGTIILCILIGLVTPFIFFLCLWIFILTIGEIISEMMDKK